MAFAPILVMSSVCFCLSISSPASVAAAAAAAARGAAIGIKARLKAMTDRPRGRGWPLVSTLACSRRTDSK